MKRCILFVEGGSNISNGNLQGGFGRLLEKAGRPMPKISAADDTANAIRRFRAEVNNSNSRFQRVLLLVDLDGPSATRRAWLQNHGLLAYEEQIFFMVQEMEAWFLSQPAVLNEHYNPKLAIPLPTAPAASVVNPDKVLLAYAKRCDKKYQKIKDGALLLGKLDLPALKSSFPDVARLVAAL